MWRDVAYNAASWTVALAIGGGTFYLLHWVTA